MLNEHVFIETSQLRLVPYLSCFTEQYHQWMCSPTLLALTESEPLSLEEEKENQSSWLNAMDKLTFILLRPTSTSLSPTVGEDAEDVRNCLASSSLHSIPPQPGMVSKRVRGVRGEVLSPSGRQQVCSLPHSKFGGGSSISSTGGVDGVQRIGESGFDIVDVFLPPSPVIRVRKDDPSTTQPTSHSTGRGRHSSLASCNPLFLQPVDHVFRPPRYCYCGPLLRCGWCDAVVDDFMVEKTDDVEDNVLSSCCIDEEEAKRKVLAVETKEEEGQHHWIVKTQGEEHREVEDRTDSMKMITTSSTSICRSSSSSSPSNDHRYHHHTSSVPCTSSTGSNAFVMIGDCNLFVLSGIDDEEEEEEEEEKEEELGGSMHHFYHHHQRFDTEEGTNRPKLGCIPSAPSTPIRESRHRTPCSYRRTFEVEVMIAESSYRQQGLATEALRMALWYGVRVLGASHFIAKVLEDNVASIQLFQKPRCAGGLGFRVLKHVPVFHEVHFGLTVGTTWRKRVKWLNEWREDWGRTRNTDAALDPSSPRAANNKSTAGTTTHSFVIIPSPLDVPPSFPSLLVSSTPLMDHAKNVVEKEREQCQDRAREDDGIGTAPIRARSRHVIPASEGCVSCCCRPQDCPSCPLCTATRGSSSSSTSEESQTLACRKKERFPPFEVQLRYGWYHKEQHEARPIMSHA